MVSNKCGGTGFTVYPNPAAGTLIIKNTALTGKPVTIQLVSLEGKTVFSKQLVISGEETRISLPAVRPGQYMINLSGKDMQESRKILIK